MKKHFFCLTGAIAGLLNGLFGAGGGVAVVPLLEHAGIDTKKSHATSIAIIAPLSLVSSLLYFQNGSIDFSLAWSYLPYGFAGDLAGSLFMKKIPTGILKRCFGAVMVISAIRLFLK